MSAVPRAVSATFDPARWRSIRGFDDLTDVTYHRGVERTGAAERDLPVVRVAFDRPEVRNAFRPHTVDELYRALDDARRSRVGSDHRGRCSRRLAGRPAPHP